MGNSINTAVLLGATLIGAASAQNVTVSVNATAKWTNSQWTSGMNIYPVWTRQNVWMPWRYWDPAVSGSFTPGFDGYMREAAIVMATGYRPIWRDSARTNLDAEHTVPDLYQGENSDGSVVAFDPNHPLFRALTLFKNAGIAPVIDIGPVPNLLCKPFAGESGPHYSKDFAWAVNGVNDYEKYYKYIRELFKYFVSSGKFTRAEIEQGWRFQLGREPDNPSTWDPANAGANLDGRNLEEYKILYDYTLAGMRDAGFNINLHPGNLMLPKDANAWTPKIAAFLVNDNSPRTAHLSLPRIRTGTANDSMVFAFSGYGVNGGEQLGNYPIDLAGTTQGFRNQVRTAYAGPLKIEVGEGNNINYCAPNKLNNRSEGSELGAAWNAGIFKAAFDSRLGRYQQWGFKSSPFIGRWDEYDGVYGAPFRVIEMYRKMEGGQRMAVDFTRGSLVNAGDTVNAIAAKNADGRLFVLVYNYNYTRGLTGPEAVKVIIGNLTPGLSYRVLHHRIDAGQGSYIGEFRKDLTASGAGTAMNSPYDALMEYDQLTPAQKNVFDANRSKYQNLSVLTQLTSNPYSTFNAASDGSFSISFSMPSNSVSLLEIETPSTPAVISPLMR